MPGTSTLRALSAPRLTSIRGAIETSLVRRATWDGRDHLVVPIVALVGDTVIYASNAPGPELVPLSELAIAPGGWNGRPVVPNHPANASGSANEPDELESRRFGTIFHARIEDDRLKFDVYLDLTKAQTIDDAQGIITRCEAGEIVEVSVGAYIAAEETAGELNGKQYVGIWRYIVPDHLAMLTEGIIGACSVEMGCGTRAAQEARNGGQNMNDQNTDALNEPAKTPSMLARFLAGFRKSIESVEPRTAELTNIELETRLRDALYLVVPAFAYVVDVKQQSKTVIYSVNTKASDWWSEGQLYQRTYRVSKDDEVTLNDDVAPVKVTQTYEVVNAETRAACACGSHHTTTETTETLEENETMANSNLSQLAARLLTRAAFKGSTLASLESLGEETLRRLDDATADKTTATETSGTAPTVPSTPAGPAAPATPQTPTPPATPASTETPTDQPTTTKSLDQWLADAPGEVQALFGHYQAQDKAHRAALVSTLTAAQKEYTAEELTAMSTPTLEKLSRAVGAAAPATSIDFSGRALPVTSASTVTPAPKPYTLALNKGKNKASGDGADSVAN